MISRLKPIGTKAFHHQISVSAPNKILTQTPPSQSIIQARGYSTSLNFIPKKTPQFATDDSGIHTVNTTIICEKEDCQQQVCYTPCGKILYMQNNGNYTHKPPTNSDSVLLSPQDFNGKTTPDGQHFVKAEPKPTLTADDLKNLTEDDLKPNKAADLYASVIDLTNKIK